MKLNHIILMQQALELLKTVLDSSPEEILECFEGELLSEEEVSEILESLE